MFDSQKIQELLALSDEELRQKILYAAAVAGADARLTGEALRDMHRLRSTLGSLSGRDLQQMLSRVDPEVLQQLDDRLSGGKA